MRAATKLPGASVDIPGFVVQASTNDAGGAGDSVATHEPKFFDIERRFADAAAARRGLESAASALGIAQSELDQTLPELGSGATVAQSRVLHGFVHGWLSVDVTITDLDAGQVQADYAFSIDVFHNPAIDRVVHNGVFAVDLRHRPTRAQLGFLPTYWEADVQPAWQQPLRAVLTLPGGRIDMPVTSVVSTSGIGRAPDPAGVQPPRETVASIGAMSIVGAHRRLRTDAGVLGLDPGAIDAIFRGAYGRQVHTTLAGRRTAIYDLSATIEAQLDEPGAYAAALSYRFTYR